MDRTEIPYKTAWLVEAVAPVNRSTIPHDPLNNADGASCSFKVFDPRKNEEISASEAIGQTVISVTNPGVFAVNDTVEILMDDAAFHASTVSAVDLTAKTITIGAGLTVAAAAGNSVRRNFGPTVTMLQYGTANLQNLAFGYRGALAYNGAYQIIDQDIDIEVSFDGGTGLEVFSVICGTITRACV